MRKLSVGIAVALAGVFAAVAYSADVKSGLQPGEGCTPFQVVDANGALKGKEHCYV